MLQDMTQAEELKKIDNQIKQTKKRLIALGHLRPGSLNEQYTFCGKGGCACQRLINPKKHGPYYQLSYFHKGKSRTEFLRSDMLFEAMRQVATYKMMKKLVDKWVELGLRRYRLIYKTSNKKLRGIS